MQAFCLAVVCTCWVNRFTKIIVAGLIFKRTIAMFGMSVDNFQSTNIRNVHVWRTSFTSLATVHYFLAVDLAIAAVVFVVVAVVEVVNVAVAGKFFRGNY